MPTRLVVIGAGVAGLSTAIHAARAGFEVEVFEAHSLPGGLCTSWRRDGYEFDGCVEWFVGSSPDSPLYESWRAVGVTPRDFVHRSVFTDHRLPDGRHVRLPGDPDRLVAEFTRVSPADAAVAGELADLVRRWPTAARALGSEPRCRELRPRGDGLRQGIAALRHLGLLRRLMVPLADFAARFRDPGLRQALATSLPTDSPLLYLVATLADVGAGNAGSPLGGSRRIAVSMARRAREVGARISYRTPVERIVVSSGRATGVDLADGRRVDADLVVAACDLTEVLEHFLGGAHPSPRHQRALRDRATLQEICLLSYGLARPLADSDDAISNTFHLPRPVTIAGHRIDSLSWKSFNHDERLTPRGRSQVAVILESDNGAWAALDPEAYDARRAELDAGVRLLLEDALPGFCDAVVAADVATPVTFRRYTANRDGAYMTFVPAPGRPPVELPRTIPGVAGLVLAGMWVAPPGGLPSALVSGEDAAALARRLVGDAFVPRPPGAGTPGRDTRPARAEDRLADGVVPGWFSDEKAPGPAPLVG